MSEYNPNDNRQDITEETQQTTSVNDNYDSPASYYREDASDAASYYRNVDAPYGQARSSQTQSSQPQGPSSDYDQRQQAYWGSREYQPQGYPGQDYQGQGYQGYPNYNPYGYEEPKRKKGISGKALVAIILCCALVFGAMGYGGAVAVSSLLKDRQSSTAHEDNSSTATPVRDENLNNSEPLQIVNAKAEDGALTIAEIAAKAKESVVEITTESVVTGTMLQQYIASGAGSGVIITEDGYIITNYHVVENAAKISITLPDGQSYTASVVGLDQQLDLGLLKIDATGLTPASLATSSNLVVGQTVVAVGNPLGQLGGSVSAGIISALDRNITIEGETMTLMQIDAAVNPGNSGGGLFNAQGNLIGIVNAKSTGTDVEGIGFAIPIDTVTGILDDLKTYGYVTGRIRIGITMVDVLTEQSAWMYRVNELGTYVYQVNEGSAAEEGGLKRGDRILSVNGVKTANASEVKAELQKAEIGSNVTIVVSRSGMEVTLTVVATEYIPEDIGSTNTSSSETSDGTVEA